MAEEDDSWIYDSVVGFLNSPIWMVPIESFVDQHCLVFDGTTQDTSEYFEIHTQYKVVVEELLESFTNDLHITSSQFIEGCQKGRAATSSYTQGMFEYVFASVNYDLFKSIMVRHNAALSLQALQMIRGNTADGARDLEEEVMKFSEQEFQTHRKEFDEQTVKEMADLEAALVKSRLDCETLLKDIEKDKSVLGENMEIKRAEIMAPSAPAPLYPEIPEFAIEPPPQEADQEAPPVPPNTSASLDDNQAPPEEQPSAEQSTLEPLPPLRATPSVQASNNAAQQWMDDAKAEGGSTSAAPAMTEQTLEERRLYWQRRKQEIVESKRSAALKTLSAHGDSAGRPKSARVAQRVLQDPTTAQTDTPPETRPAMSQALAAALRREVVHR